MPSHAVHESFSRPADIKIGSNRNFGLVFAGVFSLVGVLPLWHGHNVRWWAIGIAALFAFFALVLPRSLTKLNWLWFRFGLLLHKIMSPIILGFMYFGMITPFAVFARVFGKKPLALAFDDKTSSYWVARTPPGPAPQSMTRQF